MPKAPVPAQPPASPADMQVEEEKEEEKREGKPGDAAPIDEPPIPQPADDEQPVRTPIPRRRDEQEEMDVARVRLPNKKLGEMFGIADQLLGASRVRVVCSDEKVRMGRIPGKLRKRMWIREGDLLIIRPWEFQPVKSDVLWRYTKTQAGYLSRRKMLPKTIDVY